MWKFSLKQFEPEAQKLMSPTETPEITSPGLIPTPPRGRISGASGVSPGAVVTYAPTGSTGKIVPGPRSVCVCNSRGVDIFVVGQKPLAVGACDTAATFPVWASRV